MMIWVVERVFLKNGFTFDAGPTVITAPYLINELFELFNKNSQSYIKLKPLNIWYRFIFEDGSKFDYSGNEENMKEQIEKINKDDFIGYEKLVNFTKKYLIKVSRNYRMYHLINHFMFKQIPSLLKLKSYKSVYSLVSSYIKDDKLRRLLSMHPLLVGGNPFTTTSIYGLILYLEKKWGIHYSMGGTGQIINGLEKLMIEENIKIIKGKEVKKLISINKKITSVELEDGTQLKANNVVCNADPPAVYSNLINEKFNTIFKWKMKRMEYSMGLFVYYFGTKKNMKI